MGEARCDFGAWTDTPPCKAPVVCRYRQYDTEPWGYRCASHRAALMPDLIVEFLSTPPTPEHDWEPRLSGGRYHRCRRCGRIDVPAAAGKDCHPPTEPETTP